MAVESQPPASDARISSQALAEQYHGLRRQLIFFFARRRCPAVELADEVLFRVAVKVAEGDVRNLGAFAHGVARNVYADWQTEQIAQRTPPVDVPVPASLSRKASCLGLCMRKLSADKRELIEAYFLDDDRIALARQLRLTPNALRLQVFRIKSRLESCVTECLGGAL